MAADGLAMQGNRALVANDYRPSHVKIFWFQRQKDEPSIEEVMTRRSIFTLNSKHVGKQQPRPLTEKTSIT